MNWQSNPEAQLWLEEIRDQLIPIIDGSRVMISIAPATTDDIAFAVELGLAVMMAKPIVLMVPSSREVPPKLAEIADRIIVYDVLDMTTSTRLGAAIAELVDDEM